MQQVDEPGSWKGIIWSCYYLWPFACYGFLSEIEPGKMSQEDWWTVLVVILLSIGWIFMTRIAVSRLREVFGKKKDKT